MELNEEQKAKARKSMDDMVKAKKIAASEIVVQRAKEACDVLGLGPVAMIEVLAAAACAGTAVAAKDGHEADALDAMLGLIQSRVEVVKAKLAEGAAHV